MRNLFGVYLSAVDESGLQGFSDDWVERLEEHVEVVGAGEEAGNDEFEALNGVFLVGSLVHEVGEGGAAGDRVVERSFRMAGSHREGHFCQVELSREYLPADDLDDLLAH